MLMSMDNFGEALGNKAFRWLEGTAVFSNTSIWILTLLSGFVMETLTRAPLLITLVAVITSLTGLASASVSGAAAEARDRRMVILLAKAILLLSAAFLAIVSATGALTPTTLLIGLAGVGFAMGTSSPSWWTTVSSLVPARLVPVALSLDSFQWNIGQVVGPVVGGAVLRASGSTGLFTMCSVLLVPLLAFLAIWRDRSDLHLSTPGSGATEKTLGAISAGWQFFYYTPELRSIAARTALYVTPAVGLGSLLPLLATRFLHATPTVYGFYLALGGLGALLASLLLPRLHGMLHLDVLVALATILDAGAVVTLAVFPKVYVAIPALVATGASWVWVTTVLTIATRDSAPEWVRTRLLAIYYVVQQMPFALGGLVFGIVASFLPLRTTLVIDAGLFLPGLALIPRYGLPVVDRERQQVIVRPAVPVGDHVDPDDGPVLVLIEYQLAEDDVDPFLEAVSRLRLVRRRLGASRWGIFEDVTRHGRFVETFIVSSWDRYMLQRAHFTAADAAVESEVQRFHRGPDGPTVTRFVHPDTAEAARARSSWRRDIAKVFADPFLERPEALDRVLPTTWRHGSGDDDGAGSPGTRGAPGEESGAPRGGSPGTSSSGDGAPPDHVEPVEPVEPAGPVEPGQPGDTGHPGRSDE